MSEFRNLAKWSRKLSKTPTEFGPMKSLNLSLPTPLRCMDGVKVTAPHILIHSAGWMWAVKLTPSPLLPQEAGWAQSHSGRSGEETNSVPSAHRHRHYIVYAVPVPAGPYRLRYFVAKFILVNGSQECSSTLSTNDLANGYMWKSWSEANISAMNTQHSPGALKVVYK